MPGPGNMWMTQAKGLLLKAEHAGMQAAGPLYASRSDGRRRASDLHDQADMATNGALI